MRKGHPQRLGLCRGRLGKPGRLGEGEDKTKDEKKEVAFMLDDEDEGLEEEEILFNVPAVK